jgi:hypothetical protein
LLLTVGVVLLDISNLATRLRSLAAVAFPFIRLGAINSGQQSLFLGAPRYRRDGQFLHSRLRFREFGLFELSAIAN